MRRIVSFLLAGLIGLGSLGSGGAAAGDLAANELRGRFSLGFFGLFAESLDPRLRLSGRLSLEVPRLLGSQLRLVLDLQGRAANGGLASDALGVRELRLVYEGLPGGLAVEAGRIGLWEVEGLLLDGLALRWQMNRTLSFTLVGGARTGLDSAYGSPESDRLGMAALLRAEGRAARATLGYAELRTAGAMERRVFSGSAYGAPARALALYGHWTLDLGQEAQGFHLSSLHTGATLRGGRVFDLHAAYSSSTGFFPDPPPLEISADAPEPSLQPQPLAPEQRFGPRRQSVSLRTQVSPFSRLSLYASGRSDLRDGEPGSRETFALGTRLKLDRHDRTRLRAELVRAERAAGLGSTAAAPAAAWGWSLGAGHRFGSLLELEGLLRGRDGDLDAEATALVRFGRRTSWITTYALDSARESRAHVVSTQVAYRF